MQAGRCKGTKELRGTSVPFITEFIKLYLGVDGLIFKDFYVMNFSFISNIRFPSVVETSMIVNTNTFKTSFLSDEPSPQYYLLKHF